MKAFLLTIQIYDVSSHQLIEVETSVHSCLESAELEWKKFIYEVYLDNYDFVFTGRYSSLAYNFTAISDYIF